MHIYFRILPTVNHNDYKFQLSILQCSYFRLTSATYLLRLYFLRRTPIDALFQEKIGNFQHLTFFCWPDNESEEHERNLDTSLIARRPEAARPRLNPALSHPHRFCSLRPPRSRRPLYAEYTNAVPGRPNQRKNWRYLGENRTQRHETGMNVRGIFLSFIW